MTETVDVSLSGYTPDRALLAKVQRRAIQFITVQPMPRTPARPIITFTFDDFPKSAAKTGAAIIESVGGRGCFYAAAGMAGKRNVTGDLFTPDDLVDLAARGHEIGTHTNSHLDCATADTRTVHSEIETNRAAFIEMGLTGPHPHFAYPFGETSVALKESLKAHVMTARGILPGINRKGSDLMQLRALELGPETWTTERAARAITAASRRPAWVILFTHDVRENPSPYGTTPAALRRLVRLAHDSGAALLTPSEAMAELLPEAVPGTRA